MSKQSPKQGLSQLKLWLKERSTTTLKFNNYERKPISRHDVKQGRPKSDDAKNNEEKDGKRIAKYIQKLIDENEKESRYNWKCKSVSNYISVY